MVTWHLQMSGCWLQVLVALALVCSCLAFSDDNNYASDDESECIWMFVEI